MERYESILLDLQAWRLALGMGAREQVAETVYTEKSSVFFSKGPLPLKCHERGVITLKKKKKTSLGCPSLIPSH